MNELEAQRQVSIMAVDAECEIRERANDIRVVSKTCGSVSFGLAFVIFLVGWAIYGLLPISESEPADANMSLATVFLVGLSIAFHTVAGWLGKMIHTRK